MPELPEIETIKRGLKKKILNKRIIEIKICNSKVVKNNKTFFVGSLIKEKFLDVERRGKMLIFSLSGKSNLFMIARLGMTGQIVYYEADRFSKEGGCIYKNAVCSYKHCHIIFVFEDKSILVYNDIRRFGFLQILTEEELILKEKSFGLEPLNNDFTDENFLKLFKNKKTNIKAFLLNQKNIAGIGNIYADESLFDAGILPSRSSDTLSDREKKKLRKSVVKILKKSVDLGGTTFSDYKDSSGKSGNFKKNLKVYGREGERCLKCKQVKIKKGVVAGRGTSFCEVCQK